MRTGKDLLILTAISVCLVWSSVVQQERANAASLTGQYFKVAENTLDFQQGVDYGTVTGLVQSTLGPDGLPVVSAKGESVYGASGPITNVNSSGELLWWSPTSTITLEKTQVDQLPFNLSSFYPDGQTDDTNFFRTVHWSGSFNLASPGSATFNLGSDDDAFVFIDNTLAVDDGGVKYNFSTPTTVSSLSAGTHKFDLFYADRHASGASISFSTDVTLSPDPVPEPSSCLGILAFGTVGVGSLLRLNLGRQKGSKRLVTSPNFDSSVHTAAS